MIIGIPKEIKEGEGRVSLLPAEVEQLVQGGNEVLIQREAGKGCGFSDSSYIKVGAQMVPTLAALYRKSELVVKVKEPLPNEYRYFHKNLTLFCYLHLAANPRLTKALVRSGVFALAFETLEEKGTTPLLKPMSQIAGRLSVTVGANYLMTDRGGKGVLLSPTTYSDPASVVIVGGGSVGRAAAEIAAGLGAKVTVFDLFPQNLIQWATSYKHINLAASIPSEVETALRRADLVIGAVYIPGAKAPQVIRESMVKKMEAGSVLVDVAVDQGGASETTKPTSLSHPVYRKHGVIHYAVPNMPALVGRTASQVLSRVVFPYVQQISKSLSHISDDAILSTAINVKNGKIVHPKVRESLGQVTRNK